MFSLMGAIIIGFFAGLIARAIHPGHDKAGFIATTLLGIAGSLLATYLGRGLGWYDNESEAAGFIMSVIGAVLVLAVYTLIMRKHQQI